MVVIEKFLAQRDVDAALYLLGRMLNLDPERVGEKRQRLLELHFNLYEHRQVSPQERVEIIDSYREIIG